MSTLSILEEVEDTGFDKENNPNYIYEDCMGILNLKDSSAFWKYFNSIQ